MISKQPNRFAVNPLPSLPAEVLTKAGTAMQIKKTKQMIYSGSCRTLFFLCNHVLKVNYFFITL
jgi:hypothetical protein